MEIDYTYWQGALALGDKLKDDREHRTPSEPQAGFYRTWDNKAVAIWPDDDGLNFLVEGRQLHPHEFEDTWLKVARRPVTEEHWRNYGDTGKWHDLDPAVDETFGHNIEGAGDPETLASLLRILQDAAKAYAKIESDEESKRAHSLRNRLNTLRLRADKIREAEKKPHLEAGKKIDATWQPMIKDATAAAAYLSTVMGRWEDAKRAAIRRAEIEAAQREEEVRKAAAAGEAPPPSPPPPAEPLPEPVSQIRSGYGKAASVKTKLVIAEVKDWAMLFRRYSQHQEVKNLILNLAQKDVDAGMTVDGVITEERSSVR